MTITFNTHNPNWGQYTDQALDILILHELNHVAEFETGDVDRDEDQSLLDGYELQKLCTGTDEGETIQQLPMISKRLRRARDACGKRKAADAENVPVSRSCGQ